MNNIITIGYNDREKNFYICKPNRKPKFYTNEWFTKHNKFESDNSNIDYVNKYFYWKSLDKALLAAINPNNLENVRFKLRLNSLDKTITIGCHNLGWWCWLGNDKDNKSVYLKKKKDGESSCYPNGFWKSFDSFIRAVCKHYGQKLNYLELSY